MTAPRVAIVGRPNVGKSSLLNMIAGAKVSIVDPTPGVTRDRVAALVDLPDPDRGGSARAVEFIDTGGFGVYTAEGQRFDDVGADLSTLTADIEDQIAAAIETADLVLFCVDAQAGLTPQDRDIARRLREGTLGRRKREGTAGGGGRARRTRAPVRLVATKVDGPRWEAHAHELSGLGFGEPLMCSATSNYMRRDLLDALYRALAELPTVNADPGDDGATLPPDLSIAIIGKRNSGKSTLVNTLAGEARMIVSEIAGTTRDAVDVRLDFDGRSLLAIDTAGLRRKRSFAGAIEWYAFDRAKRAIDRADVILLLIDATEKISQVDEQLAMLAQKAFKPVIVVVNKWDEARLRPGVKGRPVGTEDYEDYLRAELKGLWFAPIAFMSARDGLNVRETVALAFELAEQAATRVTTGRLNRVVASIVSSRGPSDKLGTQAKVYYAAQTSTRPPTIVLVVNKPEMFTLNYQRFLLNRFREELPFSEVPIRLVIRDRSRGADAGEAIPARAIAAAGTAAGRLRSPTKPAGDLGDDASAYFDDAPPGDAAEPDEGPIVERPPPKRRRPAPGTRRPAGPRNGRTRGAPAPGNPAPGNPAPGNPAPGNPAPGNPAPGNRSPGSRPRGKPSRGGPSRGGPGAAARPGGSPRRNRRRR